MGLFSKKEYRIHAYGASDTGKVRQNNEDSFFLDNAAGLYILCDGMGGHNAGEVASRECINVIKAYVLKNIGTSKDYLNLLHKAAAAANSTIFKMSRDDPTMRKMGTTVVVLLIANGNYYALWAGDSRIYLLRNNKLKRITKDHSKVQMLVDAGIITEEKAWNHPEKNVILTAIGISEIIEPSTISGAVNKMDKFLLCSDGIHDEIRDEVIHEILKRNINPENIVPELISEALNAGGNDNVTVISVVSGGD